MHDGPAGAAIQPPNWFPLTLEKCRGVLVHIYPQGSHGVTAVLCLFHRSGDRARFRRHCLELGYVLTIPYGVR